MTVANRALGMISGIAFVFALTVAVPSALAIDGWYSFAFSHFLKFASGGASMEESKEEKAIDPNYLTRLLKDENSITIKGLVPSDADLKVIQGVAAATAPGANFVDRSKPSANVPDRDGWLAGITFSLRQLAKLESGVATLRGNTLIIEGTAKPEDNVNLLQQKLDEELPKGLVLQKVAVNPPAVRPFVWLAQFQAGLVNLSGHVPKEFDKVLSDYAQSLFQNFKVTSTMASASGAPENWIVAAKLSLDLLTLLQQGSVMLRDQVIRIDGVWSSPGMSQVLQTYKEKLPKGFKLEANVNDPSLRTPAVHIEGSSLMPREVPARLTP